MIMTPEAAKELFAFLDARVQEDYDIAFGADMSPWREGTWDGQVRGPRELLSRTGYRLAVCWHGGSYGHILRFDPTRMLAECELKKQIIDNHRPADPPPMTEDEMHERFCHPDWEYLTVKTGRKSDEAGEPSEEDGPGWEPNDFIDMGCAPDGTPYPRRNWSRFDYTEEIYWRRRRETPRTATVWVPDIVLGIAQLYSDHPDFKPEWEA